MGKPSNFLKYKINYNPRNYQRGKLHLQLARVVGVDIPDKRPIEISLQYVRGIGRTQSKKIILNTGLDNKRSNELSETELSKIRAEIDNYIVEGDLRRIDALNIKRLKEIACNRGRRHISGLPVNGRNQTLEQEKVSEKL